MARLIRVTYGSLVIGKDQSDASYVLVDKFKTTSTYTEFQVTFDVIVRHATRATFLASEAALVAAYSKPDQALEVVLGSTARHDYDPSDNTGFNAKASCAKVGGDEDTANSARYTCSVQVQLPANLSGRSGRQSSSVTLDTTASGKRTILIEGVYTALSSNDAYDQYTAAITTYCDSVTTGIGGTYNLVAPNTATWDDQVKVLRFRRLYQEVFFSETQAALDLASIVNQSLVIDRITESSDGDPESGSAALIRLRASFSCAVRASETTDLASLYESSVRPHIVAEVAKIARNTVVVTGENPRFSMTENTIQVEMEFAADVGASFFQARLESEETIDFGIVLVPVWDGNPFARDRYQGPATHRKVIRRITAFRATAQPATPPALAVSAGSNFVEVRRERRQTRTQIGIPGDTIPILVLVQTYVFERADAAAGTSGGFRSEVRAPELDQLAANAEVR